MKKKNQEKDNLSLKDNPLPYQSQIQITKPSIFGTLFFLIFIVFLLVLFFKLFSFIFFQKEPLQQDFKKIEIFFNTYNNINSLWLNNLSIVKNLCNCLNCTSCEMPMQEIIK